MKNELEIMASNAKYSSIDSPEIIHFLNIKNDNEGLKKEFIYTRSGQGSYKGFLYSKSLIENYIQNNNKNNIDIFNSIISDNTISKNFQRFIVNIPDIMDYSIDLKANNKKEDLFKDLIEVTKNIENLIKFMVDIGIDLDRLTAEKDLNNSLGKVIEMRGFILSLYYTVEMLIDYLPNEKTYKAIRDEAFKSENNSDLLNQINQKNELLVSQFEKSCDLTWFDKAI